MIFMSRRMHYTQYEIVANGKRHYN